MSDEIRDYSSGGSFGSRIAYSSDFFTLGTGCGSLNSCSLFESDNNLSLEDQYCYCTTAITNNHAYTEYSYLSSIFRIYIYRNIIGGFRYSVCVQCTDSYGNTMNSGYTWNIVVKDCDSQSLTSPAASTISITYS